MTIDNKIEKEAKLIVDKYGKGSVRQQQGKNAVITFSYDDEYGEKRRKALTVTNGETPQQAKLNFIKSILKRKFEMSAYNLESIENSLYVQQLKCEITSLKSIIDNISDSQKPKCDKLVSEVSEEYMLIQKQRGVSYATYIRLELFVSIINKHIGHIKLTDLTFWDIQNYIYNLKELPSNGEIASKSYVKQTISVTTAILRTAKKLGYIEDYTHLINGLEMPNDLKEFDINSRFYTYDQLSKAIFLTRENVKYKTIIWLFVLTGLRSQELFALMKEDIDRKNHRIYVHQALIKCKGGYKIGKTKTKESTRYVVATEFIISLIDDWLSYCDLKGLSANAKSKGNESFIFIDRKGDICNPTHTRCIMQSYLKFEILPNTKLSFHALRHCYATYLSRAGAALSDISQSMGHVIRGNMTQEVYIAKDLSYLDRLYPIIEEVTNELLGRVKALEAGYVNYLVNYDSK